jgi:hypothetical protein
MIREALLNVQDFIKEEHSYCICPDTIESVVLELALRNHAVSFYDVATQFTGMFGRYSGAAKSSIDYDIGVFLELASAPDSFQKDLKLGKDSNVLIAKPRYNVALAGHSRRFKEELVRERLYEDNGFFKKFLVNSAPIGVFMSADLKKAKDIECELSLIFLFMKKLNDFEITYKFNKEAEKEFDAI